MTLVLVLCCVGAVVALPNMTSLTQPYRFMRMRGVPQGAMASVTRAALTGGSLQWAVAPVNGVVLREYPFRGPTMWQLRGNLSESGKSSAVVEYTVQTTYGSLSFHWEQFVEVANGRLVSESQNVSVKMSRNSAPELRWGWPKGQHTLAVCSCSPDCNIFLCSGQCSE